MGHYQRGQNYYKKILYKENVLAQLICKKIQKNYFTKQIPWLVLLQKATRQWQQHYKENLLVELFL